MELYTCTISRMEEAGDFGIYPHDITVKSGDKRFSPTWDLLNRYKCGECLPEQYTEEYLKLMRESYRQDSEYWVSFCKLEESVAIACYCAVGDFCHRHLLRDMLQAVCKSHNIPFKFMGEL